MKKQIVALGDGLWDLFPDGPRFGGATANYACHCSILGADVHMVSGVGKDERGNALLKVYQKHGVHTDLVAVLKNHPTGVVYVELTENGLPTFTIGENAAWDHWEWKERLKKRWQKQMHFILVLLANVDFPPGWEFVKLLLLPMN